jgi:Leucine-rich repeat (LRR) protein
MFTLNTTRTLAAVALFVSFSPANACIEKTEKIDNAINTVIVKEQAPTGFFPPNLKVINLSGNRFTSVPEAIVSLVKLKDFDIRDNLLTSLPDSMVTMKNLKTLKVAGNKLTCFNSGIMQLKANGLVTDIELPECK